ncbi:Fis family transcriptional regulator [Curtobacterium sp. NPDC088465]|uniref:Fis family transcriptional regulator n=1 Tax=Curtobacterium sp. NPDC088465 TaxID=3363967 RepID=UPI0037F73D09
MRCGAEDELYSQGRCWSCALSDYVDAALTAPHGNVPAQLRPLAEALKRMQRANSGLTWIRQDHVQATLREIAATGTITHEAIDELPRSRTREFVRGLLVEHGVLPRRDHYLAAFTEWLVQIPDRVAADEHRRLIDRWIRWSFLRKFSAMDEVPQGAFLRAKQTITVGIEFLNWLTERHVSFVDITQGDIDRWLASGPSTRQFIDRLIPWAQSARLINRDLLVPRHRRGTASRMSSTDQARATERIVHTDELSPRDRAIGILVLVFGQQLRKSLQLRWRDLEISEDAVRVRLGSINVELPPPLDAPWRQLLAEPVNLRTASHPSSDWVFVGQAPGRPIDPSHIASHLRDVFSARAARLGTLNELSKLGPVPIIAEALGYSPATIEAHRIDSASTYSQYIGAVRRQRAQGI